MGISCEHLRLYVIRPTLEKLDLWSQSAENLLLGTVAQESGMGTYLKQIGGGPALGIYQMEPATYSDIWDNYLAYNAPLYRLVTLFISKINTGQNGLGAKEMITNLAYATALARVHYLRVKEPLPPASDITGLALYWKKYYNTNKGKGTVDEFKKNYEKYVT